MAKYSSEEKIQAALRYINGAESLYTIARSISTDDKSILKELRLKCLVRMKKYKSYKGTLQNRT